MIETEKQLRAVTVLMIVAVKVMSHLRRFGQLNGF